MSKTIIVVGCHTRLEYHEDFSNIVYAFEPNPLLFEDISKIEISDTYHVIQKAISTKEGELPFYLHSDSYSSSLKKWGDGPQYGEFTEIIVDVIRLDSFIEEKGIEKIDYIHIDAQGSDLDVLKSLGKYVDIVEGGELESIAPNVKYNLYYQQPTYDEVKEFLESNGFGITRVEANTGFLGSDEVNIQFKRK